MKKILLLTLVLGCCTLAVRASDVFNQGTWLLTGSVGKGPVVYTTNHYSETVPLLSLTGEYGVADDIFSKGGAIGVGAYFGYASYSAVDVNEDIWLNEFIVGARGTLHYQLVNNLDTYVGTVLGARIPSLRYSGLSKEYEENTKFAGGVFLGASYFFAENIGICGEVGYGISYANIGLVLRWE